MHRALPIALMFLLASCEQSPQPDFHGRLYFASGNHLGEFDLARATSVAVANRGAVTIRNVSGFSDGRLLLAETAIVSGEEVPRITWIDLGTGQAETLYSGVIGRYLPAVHALVWDDGSRLYVSARSRRFDVSAEVVTHNLNQLSTIIDVADDTVLFDSGNVTQRVIYSYNVTTRELEQRTGLSGTCELQGAIWIVDREQLACPAREQPGGGTEYLLVDLDGNVRGHLALPGNRRFVALAYAADQHALIMTERWTSLASGAERFAVWAYDLVDGQSYRIVKNQYLGSSAVYTAN